MRKLKNSKGFTLMEMLIVVAIIAVLIAIAVPTFLANLNKARVATDEANIRSGYASVVATVLTDDHEDTTGTKVYTLNKDGSVTAGGTAYSTLGNATAVYTDGKKPNIAGHDVTAWEKGETVTYTYNYADNTIEIKVE